jgi:hypothetical protein
VLSKKGERKQNSQEKFNTFGKTEIAAARIFFSTYRKTVRFWLKAASQLAGQPGEFHDAVSLKKGTA